MATAKLKDWKAGPFFYRFLGTFLQRLAITVDGMPVTIDIDRRLGTQIIGEPITDLKPDEEICLTQGQVHRALFRAGTLNRASSIALVGPEGAMTEVGKSVGRIKESDRFTVRRICEKLVFPEVVEAGITGADLYDRVVAWTRVNNINE